MSNHPLKWALRDPVENAYWAFTALSSEQKAEMVARYNDVQSRRAHPDRLEWHEHERKSA